PWKFSSLVNEKTKIGSRLGLLEAELKRSVEVASGELGAYTYYPIVTTTYLSSVVNTKLK
ncbi:MAG: hypothetical protein QOI57_3215, partial [Rubrobacteraceae bacterium]|nr:hypothetical protein [Rubrobacteraceae bacterium]